MEIPVLKSNKIIECNSDAQKEWESVYKTASKIYNKKAKMMYLLFVIINYLIKLIYK